MKEDDLDEVHSIEKKSFPSPWSKKAFFLELKNKFSHLYVWEEDERVLGYIIWRSIAGEVHIINIAVHPEHRRKGIGKRLLEFCIEKEKDAEYVVLEVRASNIPARNLYKNYGFREIATIKGYYSFPSEDGIVMMKKLN